MYTTNPRYAPCSEANRSKFRLPVSRVINVSVKFFSCSRWINHILLLFHDWLKVNTTRKGPIASAPMMDGVDLDVAQARADLLPDKYDRRRISQALASRRLSSQHYKRPMSEGNVCSGWMLLVLLVCSLHHIHSKYWWSFKRRHALLVCFVSLPVALCWKACKKLWKELGLSDVLCACFVSLCRKAGQICQKLWKEFVESDAVCDGTVILGLYWEIIFELWLFLKRHWLTMEVHIMYIESEKVRPRGVMGSKVSKEPIVHVMYEMVLCYGTGWAWFRSLLIGPSHLVIRQLLIISGDVELNPGPLDDHKTVEEILETIDDTTLGVDDWNIVVIECKSLSAEWKQLSTYLGLSFEVTDNIKGFGDNHHCWSEALKHWIRQNYNTKKFGVPSWRCLLKAVAKVDKLTFKKLAAEHQVNAKPVEPDVPDSSLSGYEDGGKSKHELSPRKVDSDHEGVSHVKVATAASTDCVVTSKHVFTFRCLNLKGLTKAEREQLHQKLYTESEDMMYKFQDLFSATTDSLKQRGVPAKELARHLQCLGHLKPTVKDSGEPVFGRQVPELKKMELVDDAMSVVNNYCSFFNYRMLEHIINKLGTEQDKLSMAEYKEDFAKYGERHVFQCPSEVGKMNEEGHANMFVTLDDLFDNCNVNHLQSFVGNLQKALGLSSDAGLTLYRIESGSLKLIFQLPHSVQQALFPLSEKKEALLADLGVVELSCGDYQFTRQQNKEVEDPCASDIGDSDYADSDAELASMAAGLTLRKPGDTFSITDSDRYLGRSNYTSTTAAVTVATEDILHRPDLDDPDMGMGHDSSAHELRLASERGDLEAVKYLTEEKLLNPLQEDKDGLNAIHYAAWGGQLGVLKYFIEEQGHNPASQCSPGKRLAGWTSLHVAARYNHLELVQYLIADQHMDPMCQANDGSTPLHKACHGDNIDVVIYLVNAMSKYLPLKDVVNCRGRDGQTPLHTAALCGQLKIVQYLITELNCDPNIVVTGEHHGRPTVGGGRIALHAAAQRGHLHMVKFLIEDQHCDPSHCDYEKVTPLHLAAQYGHLAVVQYLTLEQHCDPLCTNKKNNTPLHLAALRGHLQVVKFMIETLHCPPDIRGQHNMTPLDAARSRGHHHVVQYLESICPQLK